ncbi:MAG TPA: hypothetical protein VG890_03825, partial [Puia sp.]|nr:hypothetical protein [Puia sp.]
SFIIKILLTGLLLVLLDQGLGRLLEHSYFKIRHGEQGRTTYAIDSCVSEIIILGSSRAAHHYVSPVISRQLGISCYNAGKDKQRLRYCLAMLNMLYKRYYPKFVILDLNPTAFETAEGGLDELSVLLPYYRSHPEIREIVNERSRFEWLKTYSLLYCYNSLPLKILFNNISNERDANERMGYVPLVIHKEILPDKPEYLPSSQPIDQNLVNCFRSIISLTREKGSRLVVVVSPIYNQLPSGLKTMALADSICKKENIAFLDYSHSEPFFSNGPRMFLDAGHLNDSSAVLFTKMLCIDLKKCKSSS